MQCVSQSITSLHVKQIRSERLLSWFSGVLGRVMMFDYLLVQSEMLLSVVLLLRVIGIDSWTYRQVQIQQREATRTLC